VAKYGTNSGGRRVRAGDKPQPLAEKITAGKAAQILKAPELPSEPLLEAVELDGAAALYGEDMPAPSDYLSARQKDGKPLGADALFKRYIKNIEFRPLVLEEFDVNLWAVAVENVKVMPDGRLVLSFKDGTEVEGSLCPAGSDTVSS
jgi:hypothetical protein